MGIERLQRYQPQMLSVMRIVVALVYMQHGLEKVFEFPGPHDAGPLVLFGHVGVAGLLETFGGLAVLLGLFTRPAAFLLSGEMAIAFWTADFPRGIGKPYGFFPVNNHGDLPVLFCFVFLYLVFAGGGVWSLDALRNKTRS